MKNFALKARHLLPAFFMIALSCIGGLMLLRYYLNIKFQIITLKEEYWQLWLPMILPAIPVMFWFRKKTRILKFKGDRDRGLTALQFSCWISIAVAGCSFQDYLENLTATLSYHKNPAEIPLSTQATHYRFDSVSFDTTSMGTYMDIRTSGKTNNELNFDYYVVIPFSRSELIGESPDPSRTFAIKFHKQISSRASQLEKEQTVAALLVKANAELRSYSYRNPDHFKRVRPSEKLELYKLAAGFSRLQLDPEQVMFLEPQEESYANRTGKKLYWGIGFLLAGSLIITMFLIFTGFDKAEYRRQLKGAKPADGDLEDMLKFLLPSGNHFVTSIIMDLIILVFLIMTFSGVNMISPRGVDLMAWGANRRPEVLNGEWWRLLTSIFLHGGIIHLVSNIIGLALAAIFVEPRMGRKKYAVLFLVSGIAGSMVSITWHDRNPSVGASGAIFGLYGALIALALLKKLPADENKFALGFAGIFVGINLLYGLTGNIDNAGHLGGLFAGGLAGVLLYKPPPVIKTRRLRRKMRVGGDHSHSVT